MSDLLAVIAARESEGRGDEGGVACLSTQILWDADNAKMFGDLCRRTLRFCDEGRPCPLVSTGGRILLVSSQRGLTSASPPLLRSHRTPGREAAPAGSGEAGQ